MGIDYPRSLHEVYFNLSIKLQGCLWSTTGFLMEVHETTRGSSVQNQAMSRGNCRVTRCTSSSNYLLCMFMSCLVAPFGLTADLHPPNIRVSKTMPQASKRLHLQTIIDQHHPFMSTRYIGSVEAVSPLNEPQPQDIHLCAGHHQRTVNSEPLYTLPALSALPSYTPATTYARAPGTIYGTTMSLC